MKIVWVSYSESDTREMEEKQNSFFIAKFVNFSKYLTVSLTSSMFTQVPFSYSFFKAQAESIFTHVSDSVTLSSSTCCFV